MKYKQVDLPGFASLASDGRVLIIKSADTFVAVRADAYGDDDYELEVRNYPLTTALLLELEFITMDEADKLYAAERERTKARYRGAELRSLLRLVRKFPTEAKGFLPLPTSFTTEKEAQKKRETELAELASLMKLVRKHPGFAKDFLAEAALLDTPKENKLP